MEVIGKNFDANNLKVYTNFELPLSIDGQQTKFKVIFDILEKSDTRILVKFPSNIDFPKPTSEVLNARIKNGIPKPSSSAGPGDPSYDYVQKYSFSEPNYCFNEWGVGSIQSFELYVETDSGRVPIVINQGGYVYSGFVILPEIPENNLNNYMYNCFIYPELRGLIMGRVSYELKSIVYQKDKNRNISIPLPTYIQGEVKSLPIKYTRPVAMKNAV